MITKDDLYKKSFAQILLYFLQEKENNPYIKTLIITNYYEWFVFDVTDMQMIAKNSDIQKLYREYQKGVLLSGHTKDFYETCINIMQKNNMLNSLPFTYIDINDIKRNSV